MLVVVVVLVKGVAALKNASFRRPGTLNRSAGIHSAGDGTSDGVAGRALTDVGDTGAAPRPAKRQR